MSDKDRMKDVGDVMYGIGIVIFIVFSILAMIIMLDNREDERWNKYVYQEFLLKHGSTAELRVLEETVNAWSQLKFDNTPVLITLFYKGRKGMVVLKENEPWKEVIKGVQARISRWDDILYIRKHKEYSELALLDERSEKRKSVIITIYFFILLFELVGVLLKFHVKIRRVWQWSKLRIQRKEKWPWV